MQLLHPVFLLLLSCSFAVNYTMEVTPAEKEQTNTATTAETNNEFTKKILAFFADNKIAYVDQTMSTCCGAHHFSQLYTPEECLEQLQNTFNAFAIPMSALDNLLERCKQNARDILIITKVAENRFMNSYVIEKDLHEQMPNTTCKFSDAKLSEEIIKKKELKLSINLKKIQDHVIAIATNDKKIRRMYYNDETLVVIFEDGTRQTFGKPVQEISDKEVVGYVAEYNGIPEYLMYSDGSKRMLNSTKPLRSVKQTKTCNECTRAIAFYQTNVTFCPDHDYCEECFYTLFDLISECPNCIKFEAPKTEQRSQTVLPSKESKQEVTTPVINAKELINQELPKQKMRKADIVASLNKKLETLPTPQNNQFTCSFCSNPRGVFKTDYLLCDDHNRCKDCYYGSLEEISQCTHCERKKGLW